jgi:splicing factor 3B subunit 1
MVHLTDSLYLGAEDAMVPFYPNLAELDDERNAYDRYPLYYFV